MAISGSYLVLSLLLPWNDILEILKYLLMTLTRYQIVVHLPDILIMIVTNTM